LTGDVVTEALLHADSAAIGIALAQEYPGITQPLYAGGALRAQTRAARDAFQAQTATYRGVVLEAFGQVADDLRALEHDAAGSIRI
jgi:outer membrane protein TolC